MMRLETPCSVSVRLLFYPMQQVPGGREAGVERYGPLKNVFGFVVAAELVPGISKIEKTPEMVRLQCARANRA